MKTVEEAAGARPAARPARACACVFGLLIGLFARQGKPTARACRHLSICHGMTVGRWAWERKANRGVVEMSNSDCGDRGLATRRGVRVSRRGTITPYCTCTARLPSPKAQSCGTTSQMAAICTKLCHPLVCLHQVVFFSGCKPPSLVIRQQGRVRPGPWTGLGTTAAGLRPSLEELPVEHFVTSLGLSLARGQDHLLPADRSISHAEPSIVWVSVAQGVA